MTKSFDEMKAESIAAFVGDMPERHPSGRINMPYKSIHRGALAAWDKHMRAAVCSGTAEFCAPESTALDITPDEAAQPTLAGGCVMEPCPGFHPGFPATVEAAHAYASWVLTELDGGTAMTVEQAFRRNLREIEMPRRAA